MDKYVIILDTKVLKKAIIEKNLYMKKDKGFEEQSLVCEEGLDFSLDMMVAIINNYTNGDFYYKESFERVDTFEKLIACINDDNLYYFHEELKLSEYRLCKNGNIPLSIFKKSLDIYEYYSRVRFLD